MSQPEKIRRLVGIIKWPEQKDRDVGILQDAQQIVCLVSKVFPELSPQPRDQ